MTEELPSSDVDSLADRIAASIEYDETIDLLQDLVRIPSPYFEEREAVEFVYDWLDEQGLDPSYHDVRESEITGYEGKQVVARIEGADPSAPTLLLNGHLDTVKIVDEWEEDPLSGRIEDGRLYGQGACDMKGGTVSHLVAFKALADADVDWSGDVLLTAVVDEEGPYGLGSNQLIRDGYTDEADMAIVTEPGPILAQEDIENPALLLGARGRFLYEFDVYGEAAHGSQPYKGTNAIVDAGRIADALTEMPVGSHPQLGDGSVCPLKIEGGSETLSVPEHCKLYADRHVVIGESKDDVIAQAEELIVDLDLDSEVAVSVRDAPAPDVYYGPYVTDADHELVRALEDGTEAVTGKSPEIGYFASVGDFNYFGHRADLPTVIVGPDGENIHGAGEFVYTDDVLDVARTVAHAATHLVA
ncbi:MAG: M20 family metallopeptidase [Halobacteriota archaeon]